LNTKTIDVKNTFFYQHLAKQKKRKTLQMNLKEFFYKQLYKYRKKMITDTQLLFF